MWPIKRLTHVVSPSAHSSCTLSQAGGTRGVCEGRETASVVTQVAGMSDRTQLFVGCLHPDVTEEAISSLLKGKLSVMTRKCVVMRHRHSVGGSMSGKKGDSRGFGFITIDSVEVQRVKDAATTGELVLNDQRIVI